MIATRRKNKRKHSEPRRWRLPDLNWRRWGMTAASLAGIGIIVALIGWTLDQPIENVEISGRFQRVSPPDVQRAVKQRVRGAGLVSVNLEDVRAAIDAIPWVDSVSVERAWPRGLRVMVVEQVAAARW